VLLLVSLVLQLSSTVTPGSTAPTTVAVLRRMNRTNALRTQDRKEAYSRTRVLLELTEASTLNLAYANQRILPRARPSHKESSSEGKL